MNDKLQLKDLRKMIDDRGGVTKFSAKIDFNYNRVYKAINGYPASIHTIRRICRSLGIEISQVKEWR